MSFENVVLQYPHPCIAGIFVEDNTVNQETFLTPEEPVTMLQCGAFATGRDNQLLYYRNYDEFVNELGEPNFALYGQAGYNVANALKTGDAAAYVMRVMPDDASYANLVVMAQYGIAEGKLNISYTLESVEGVTSEQELAEAVDAMRKYDPEDDGSFKNPLFYVFQTGRGAYGNATRVRFNDVTAYDDPEITNRMYRLDVLQMSNTLKRVEYAFGCFNPELFDVISSESLYLPDLVNDPENGLAKVNMGVIDSTVNAIVDMYNEANSTTETNSTLDILFGKNMDGTANNLIVFGTNELNYTEGVSLNSGSDGSFAPGEAGRDEAITAQLVKAYSGELDKRILSRYSTPCNFVLDANFDDSVKKAMVGMALKRKWDAMTYIDAGLISTVEEAKEWLNSMEDYWGNNVVKEVQHYKIRDVHYTGKTIPVTTTYFLAGKIPKHIKTKGLNTPLTLEDARIYDAVKGTFLPEIDPDEENIKAELYNARANYYEVVKYGVYQRGCAITTQKVTSDRLDEFNEYILQLAVKKAVEIMRSKIYKFGEATDRANYKQLADAELQHLLGGLVRSVTVDFKMSQTDERRNILRIVLRIVYRTVVKRGIVEIYLDPRA